MFKTKHQSGVTLEAEKLDWLRLFRTENVGAITFYRLLERYGSAGEALAALPELAERGGRKKPFIAPPVSEIEAEHEKLRGFGGDILTAGCDGYPDLLAACDDAPPVLSYKGDISLLNKSCVAMVGARNASLNGRKLTEKTAHELGERQQIVVSGLARGIDTAAHMGSLSHGTIAVVAGGLDKIYPQENTKLFHEISERGLILAESPFGTSPQARHFPKRNRIVSGLSRACVVVEATMRSGSLITARRAGEQGREVMALPGSPLDPRAQGPNHLIREGATLVRNAEDILEGLLRFAGQGMREPVPSKPSFEAPPPANEDIPEDGAAILLDHLSFTPVRIDELLRACHMSIPVLQTILLELEIAGRVKRLPGNRISLIEAE
jgi:DNA processing protein